MSDKEPEKLARYAVSGSLIPCDDGGVVWLEDAESLAKRRVDEALEVVVKMLAFGPEPYEHQANYRRRKIDDIRAMKSQGAREVL